MTDCILPRDYCAILETGGDVMCEIRDDGWEDRGAGFVHAADDGEEVDCGFEASGEEAGTGQEEVSNGGRLEVEG